MSIGFTFGLFAFSLVLLRNYTVVLGLHMGMNATVSIFGIGNASLLYASIAIVLLVFFYVLYSIKNWWFRSSIPAVEVPAD